MKLYLSPLTLALVVLAALTAPLAAQTVAPTIVMPPDDLTILVGDSIYFFAAADGDDPLSYQWRKNGSALAGATGDTYLKDSSLITDAGDYTVKVFNSAGAVTSAVATLTILIPPTITIQPLSKTAIAGTNVTFIVKASGSLPLEYQWFDDGIPIPGATTTNLTLVNVQPDDEDDYTVTVSNPATDYGASVAVSSPASLTVLVPPTIMDQPDGDEISQGESTLFSVVAAGTDTDTCPLTYQWLFKGKYMNGETDRVLVVADALAGDAGNYQVIVANAAGSVVSSNANLIVDTPPVFTVNPVSRTVYPGANWTLTASADGTAPIAYQWYFNGEAIDGATNTSYAVFIAGTAQRGYYSVLASNVADDYVWSLEAYLTVKAEAVKPTVAITFPTEGMRCSNAPITVRGIAADNAAVDFVEYADHYEPSGQGFQRAAAVPLGPGLSTWTNWTATFTPTPGTNLVRAVATDDSANRSTTAEVHYFFVVPSPFIVNTNGPGTASTNLGSNLEIGRGYTLTAVPGAGAVFTNWTGGYTTNNATIKFLMTSNLVLNMNFVDVQAPTVSITNGLPGGTVSNALAVVRGTAADNWQVAAVWYRFNGNAWTLAAGTINWTATVGLVTGTNTFSVYSVDAAGKTSSTNTTTGIVALSLPPPVVTSIVRQGGRASISFTTIAGLVYDLECKSALADTAWTVLAPSVPGTGGVLTVSDTNAPTANRYYRVRAQ